VINLDNVGKKSHRSSHSSSGLPQIVTQLNPLDLREERKDSIDTFEDDDLDERAIMVKQFGTPQVQTIKKNQNIHMDMHIELPKSHQNKVKAITQKHIPQSPAFGSILSPETFKSGSR